MAGGPEGSALELLQSQFPSLASTHRSVRCIVKLGGAAITRKDELETINDPVMAATTSHLREAMGMRSSGGLKMDWSRRDGVLDVELPSDSGGQQLDIPNAFIVVHGAGSFGHFQASRSGVNKGWSTHKQTLKRENVAEVLRTVDAGFVPVLHGDAVLDSAQGCTILSGDVVVRRLAQDLKPSYVVFLTNVPGVFDRPPSEPDATLLKEIVVFEDCSWTIVDPPFVSNTKSSVQTTVAAHDTTGGMATKIAEAASIAAAGIDVYVVEAGTPHALEALRGNVKHLKSKKQWKGTFFRSAVGRPRQILKA